MIRRVVYATLLDEVEARRPACLVLVLAPRERAGERHVAAPDRMLAGPALSEPDREWMLAGVSQALQERRTLALAAPESVSGLEAYFEPFPPRPDLVIVGGGHVGKALYDLAAPLPIFDITVVDDRPAYTSRTRFPLARETVCCAFEETFDHLQITEASYVVIITRGHRADRTCLAGALRTAARYIGMIGSRRKVLLTYRRLEEAGVAREDLRRVHAPIGLDLGATGAAEIAVSVLAELLAVKNGRDPAAITSLSAGLLPSG